MLRLALCGEQSRPLRDNYRMRSYEVGRKRIIVAPHNEWNHNARLASALLPGCGFKRARSAGRLRTPGLLRHPPVDAFQQITKLRGRDGHRAICWRRPQKATTLQPLGKQAHALSIMPKHFDQAAAPPAEHEQMPAVRVVPQRLLHHECQAIKTFAHVGVAARQPDPGAARDRDHRRRFPLESAFISADTVEASTAPVIRIRPPPANSISITPMVSG